MAIKLENRDLVRPQLVYEFVFYRKLSAEESTTHKGIPQIHYFGPSGAWNALIMELLGPSIADIHIRCGNKFSLKTTILLAKQLIEMIEYFHGKGLIYRDTKPENFLFGPSGSDKYSIIHNVCINV